jgi:hypothetical protein
VIIRPKREYLSILLLGKNAAGVVAHMGEKGRRRMKAEG